MEQEELQRLIEVFLPLKRQGPGSEIETLMALGLTGLDTSKEVQVLDIGSGTGVQTLTLAKALKGTIHAVDLIPEFLDELEKGLGVKIYLQLSKHILALWMHYRFPPINLISSGAKGHFTTWALRQRLDTSHRF